MKRERLAIASCLLAALAPDCGARTGLRDDGPPRAVDVPGAADATIDRPADAPPPECTTDAQCDDRIACTRDRCDVAAGRCVRTPTDSLCDDGRYCNGAERCAPGVGCAPGVAPACADAIDCTRDGCDDAMGRCVSTPDDALCPISHRCDVARGCVARAIANTSTDLFEVELPSAVMRSLGRVRAFTDVALHPDRTLYAVTAAGEIWRVDASTAGSVFEASTGRGFTALDAAPDGALYAAGHDGLFRVNVGAGSATFVAAFPPGLEASGDLALLGGRLLATARTGPGSLDTLVEFDVGAGTSRTLGPIGFTCVWGLAAFGPTLYGFTCAGSVLLIDPATGNARELAHTTVMFYGATAR